MQSCHWSLARRLNGSIPWVFTTTLVVLSLCVSSTTTAGTLKLYWSSLESNVIHRSNLDGTASEQLLETPGGVIPNISFDPVEQRMYWPSPVAGGIQSSDYDGANVSTSIAGITEPTSVAIDPVNRKAYWVNYGSPSTIWRGNLDGTARERVVDDLVAPRDIQVDPLHGFYYWIDFFGDIHRKSFDGTETEESLFARSPRQLAIDPTNGYIYATDSSFQAVISMKLDFSQPMLWITEGVSSPSGIVIDLADGRVIWSNQETSPTSPTSPNDTNISSVDFAGTDQRIDFYPQWNIYAPAMVQHLGITNIATPVSTPEPNSIALACIGGVAISLVLRGR